MDHRNTIAIVACLLGLISLVVWSGYNALKPAEWGMVRASVGGQEYYMLQVCRVGCDLLGYRYPTTEAGLEQAKTQLGRFEQPDPVILEVLQ